MLRSWMAVDPNVKPRMRRYIERRIVRTMRGLKTPRLSKRGNEWYRAEDCRRSYALLPLRAREERREWRDDWWAEESAPQTLKALFELSELDRRGFEMIEDLEADLPLSREEREACRREQEFHYGGRWVQNSFCYTGV